LSLARSALLISGVEADVCRLGDSSGIDSNHAAAVSPSIFSKYCVHSAENAATTRAAWVRDSRFLSAARIGMTKESASRRNANRQLPTYSPLSNLRNADVLTFREMRLVS